MTSVDIFKSIKSDDKMSPLYHQIVKEIEQEIQVRYPEIYESVIQINIYYSKSNSPGGLDVLHGLTQEGKSPAIIISLWLQNFKHFNSTAFLTKNLGSIRQDIMMKLENGFLNDIIQLVCNRHGCGGLSDYFKLRPFEFDKKSQLKQCTWRSVPVMLLNKANYRALIAFYRQVANEKSSMIFMIDELHQMYADLAGFIDNKGLLRGKTSSRHIMHWIINKAKEDRCQILGVTATPYRAMTSDPVCFPRSVIPFHAGPPFPGAVYCGYDRKKQILVNINVDVYDVTKLADHILKIMNLQRRIVNGHFEVPFICITTERLNAEQQEISDLITERFGDRIHCRTFNDSKFVGNARTLAEFFNPLYLTPRVCQEGAFILIGKARLDTGVTVKPELKKSCQVNVENKTYEIFGITDQIMATVTDSTHAQSLIQMMRITGWYHPNHASRLWVPDQEHVKLYSTALIAMDNEFATKYDGNIGPESVKTIKTHSKLLKGICGSGKEDSYCVSEKFGYDLKPMKASPAGADYVELETHIYPGVIGSQALIDICKELKNPQITPANVTLSDLYNQSGAQALFRKEYYLKLPTQKGVLGVYNQSRGDSIMYASVDPKGENTQWQVNGFVWGKGNGGDIFKTKLSEVYIVMFKDNWEKRRDNQKSFNNNNNPGKILYFHRGNDWITVGKSKVFEHKYLDQFADFNSNPRSEDHILACGADIDKLADEFKKGTGQANPWGFFRTLCTLFNKSGTTTACSSPYKKLKSHPIYESFKAIVKQEISRSQMLDQGTLLLQPIFNSLY